MNKIELITFLRDSNKVSPENLKQLERIIHDNPYFLSARLLLAKGSKELKHPRTKKRIASAAIYSTDRNLLKKYLRGDLLFLGEPPSRSGKRMGRVRPENESKQRHEERRTHHSDISEIPSGNLDAILEELKQDMQNLKTSRQHFAKVQEEIEEDDAISKILEKTTQMPEKNDEFNGQEDEEIIKKK